MPVSENFVTADMLRESSVALLPTILSNPTVERKAIETNPQLADDPMVQWKASGLLMIEENGPEINHPVYHHVEVGRYTNHIEFAGYAAPGIGNNLVLTITGPFNQGTHPVRVGDRYSVNGIMGEVVAVALPNITLQIIGNYSQWPAGNAGIGLYAPYNPAEMAYATSRVAVPDVAVYSHLVEEVQWMMEISNRAAFHVGDWVQAPVSSPWAGSVNVGGWLNKGLNDTMEANLNGMFNAAVLGQRPGGVRANGDPLRGDGILESYLNNAILIPNPAVVDINWIKMIHRAVENVAHGSREISIACGVNLSTKISEFQRAEMNGSQVQPSTSRTYDFLYSEMVGTYGAGSKFRYINNTTFDNPKGLGAIGWMDMGISVPGDGRAVKYTDGSRVPSATLRMFKPMNNEVRPAATGSGTVFSPYHWAKSPGASFVGDGENFTNTSTNSLKIFCESRWCLDMRNTSSAIMIVN